MDLLKTVTGIADKAKDALSEAKDVLVDKSKDAAEVARSAADSALQKTKSAASTVTAKVSSEADVQLSAKAVRQAALELLQAMDSNTRSALALQVKKLEDALGVQE